MTRLFWAACAAYAVAWAWAFAVLPDRVPLHFAFTGEADRFGGRTEALVSFAVIGVAVGGLLALALLGLRRGSTTWLNVPHKDWWIATPEREARMRRMMTDDVAAISAGTMVLLTVVLAATVAVSDQPTASLPWWVLGALAGYLVGIVAWTVLAYTSRYRPPDEAS